MRPLAARALRLMPALAAAMATATGARGEDVPAVISPLRIEADANGVNLVDGRTAMDAPVLSVPGAPNLRFDGIQNAAPYLSGHVLTPTGSETDERTYSIHTGAGTSESFRCIQYECASVTGTGSTFAWSTRTYLQAGTGAVWRFGLRQVETPSPNRWLAYHAGSVSYPNGEEIGYRYDRVPAPGDPFGRILHRPTRIASNLGFHIVISYHSDDVAAAGWSQVREAAIYSDGDPETPLGRLTYGTDGTIRDQGGRVYACEGCATLLGAEIEVSAGSLRLPGEEAPSRRVVALAAAPVVGSVVRDGVAWSYAYDNLRQQQASVGYLYDGITVTGPDGHRTVYEFTATGPSSARRNVITRVTDPLGRATLYAHDSFYRLLRVTYPEGNEVSVVYDAYGNITARTSTPKPNMGQAIGESAFYPVATCPGLLCSRPAWTRDALGRQTDYVWNERGQLVRQTDPADAGGVRRRTEIAYQLHVAQAGGTLSRRRAVTVCGDVTTCGTDAELRTEYDYWGDTFLVSAERRYGAPGEAPLATTYGYDAAGRLISTDGPLPGSDDATWNRYDDHGRRTWEIGARGPGGVRIAARTGYRDADDRPVRVETGTLADLASSDLQNIRRTDIAYDARRNPIREAVSAGGTIFGLVERSFDAHGRRVCEARRMNPAVFAAPPAEACAPGPQGSGETDFGPDRIVRNSYDAAGQLLRIEEAYGVTVANGFPATQQQEVASYTYSPNGRRTSLTDGNGNRAEMMWDGHDRQRRWVFPSPAAPGQANPADYEEYGYDAAGNRTSLRKRDGRTIAFAYDALNRLIARTYPQGGARAVHYGYGLRGEQLFARFDSPAGEGVTNGYDAFGRLASSRIDLGGVARTLSYRYDEAGTRTRLTHPDGQYFEYRHDALGRFTGIRENGYSDVVGQSWHPTGERFILGRTGTAMGWLYDAIGRPSYQIDDMPNGAGTSWTFERNPASQIVAAARTNDAYAWTGHYPVARAYAANGLNQYSAAGGASFAYDANGNLTSDGSRSYGYDIENRLVGASSGPSTGSGGTLTLAYDPLGRLFQTSGGASGTTRFLYDGDDLIAEYDGAGALLRRYVHGPGADEPLLRYEGAGVAQANRRHLVADWQGSIVAITDATGNRLSLNAYDEYGIPAATNSGRFQYTGQIWLPDLGMYHYKARVYSPTLGRFLQTDPVGYDDQFNLYAYVANDPVNHADPDGMQMAPDPRRPIVEAVVDFLFGDIANAVSDPSAPNIAIAIITTAPPGRVVGGVVRTGRFLNRLARPAGKIVTVSHRAHPEAAAHIERAQAAGHPRTLTVDRVGARSNRAEAMRGQPRRAGTDRDEYPPAMFQEGGHGSSVENIRPSDNRGAGASISRQCRNVRNGERVTIVVCR